MQKSNLTEEIFQKLKEKGEPKRLQNEMKNLKSEIKEFKEELNSLMQIKKTLEDKYNSLFG